MKKVLREPLVHFLLLGGLLFLWFQWRGGAAGPGTSRIVVSPGQVRNLASGYTKTWSRPPSKDELRSSPAPVGPPHLTPVPLGSTVSG